ncbi:hypothetical protein DRO56_05035 [Candidatus Bathyarchaeota archaeon]|nr:MAG: hypothetical protein CW700_01880 [Candidatus Bathyarchaeota archaeon]RLI31542.1 MAG: hypothetical protein DRO56_05035 [Candidatus Bathyarchaeota archaeon]
MTSFESFFDALKKALGKPDLYEIWPDFEPVYDESEYSWTNLRGLGEVLLLNCGDCDGPSDLRHPRCDECVKKRGKIALEAYTRATGKEKKAWTTIMLCRIHSPD